MIMSEREIPAVGHLCLDVLVVGGDGSRRKKNGGGTASVPE